MQTTARLAPQPRLGWLLLIVLALIAVVGVALLTAGQRTRPAPPFGLAANGAVAYAEDGDIYRYDIPTGQRLPLIIGPTYDFGGTFSRDGTRLTFGRISAGHVDDADPPLSILVAGDRRLGHQGADRTGQRQLLVRLVTGWGPDRLQDATAERLRAAQRPRCRDRHIDHPRRRLVRPMQWHRVASPGRPGDRLPGRRRRAARGLRHPAGRDRAPPGQHADPRSATAIAALRCHPMARPMTVTRWGDEGARIWLLDLNTGTERVLPIPPATSARGGAFSPDGRLLAYPLLHRVSARAERLPGRGRADRRTRPGGAARSDR